MMNTMSYSYPFRQKALRHRHDTAPLLEQRDQYLNHLLRRGTSTRLGVTLDGKTYFIGK